MRLRTSDVPVREQAATLATQVRDGFIAYHLARTAGFEMPPTTTIDDALNVWVPLPAGTFTMGSLEDPLARPPHAVQLTSGFSMQQHEVTNSEYARFDPTRTFPLGEGRHPVVGVSWYEAAGYAAWLGATLPTEAQWEYAARGTGATSGRTYPWGDREPDDTRAVYGGSPRVKLDAVASIAVGAKPVGDRPAGATPEGLHDMAGNVWEWCRDWYAPYRAGSVSDPLGPVVGDRGKNEGNLLRVARGGSFNSPVTTQLRSVYRSGDEPFFRRNDFGFRLVFSTTGP